MHWTPPPLDGVLPQLRTSDVAILYGQLSLHPTYNHHTSNTVSALHGSVLPCPRFRVQDFSLGTVFPLCHMFKVDCRYFVISTMIPDDYEYQRLF